jgi:hypothetical protein
VKTLLKAPNLTEQEAMLVAKFLMKDIENKNMQKIIARRIPGGKRAMAALLPPALLPPSIIDVPQCDSPQISNSTSTLSGTNLQLLIDERIRKEKPTSLSPWIVGLVVFGGCDPETELIVRSAFQEGLGKSWSRATQQEMPREQEGAAFDR